MNYDWEKEFYAPWDQFVKAWWDEKADPSDLVTKGYKKGRKLDLNELPEPYLGSPKNAKAVVINYNPGTSTANENTKFFSSYNRKGALITEFVDNHRNLYSSYNKKWSSLNSSLDNFRPAIPGVKWWKGRFRWIERFMMHFPCIAAGGIKRENVFALEMCPYHSKGWQGTLEDQCVLNFVKQRVINPAARAVIETLPSHNGMMACRNS